jgi:hypothetical protein
VNTYTGWWRHRWNSEYLTDELPQYGADGGQRGADLRTDLVMVVYVPQEE